MARTRLHSSRITTGLYRYGLIAQPGEMTRPVGQKIRAAIFDVIGHELNGLVVLDLYAGSGALGFEALSRGAEQVTMVEKNRRACRVVEENARSLGAQPQLVCQDVTTWLEESTDQFDVIFLDPPYAQFSEKIAAQAAQYLQPAGIMVISCAADQSLSDKIGTARQVKRHRYGSTQIAYYEPGDV